MLALRTRKLPVMVDSTDQKPNCISAGQSDNESNVDTSLKEKKAEEDLKGVTEECPAGVSLQLWKKFQELKDRRSSITKAAFKKKSRWKRKAAGTDPTKVETNDEKSSIKMKKFEQEQKIENKSDVLDARESHWSELKQYFGTNDRFEIPACSAPPLKTNLEKNLDKAIATGDIEEAEKLSDSLAVRRLGVKIAKAIKCRDFAKVKQETEASQQAQKKKQLAWGFEAKRRWETKSNMGYM
ncbi:protein FAM204A isoform X2 [Rhincodon typus]|uniref:protein FAM204A isoform X2 n=1 Tax=Rhincodon typus TaxID=259920 RepID=UPI00202F8983|nr:protein FAM204A isoform X2 [Rhincodon typus]